MACIVLIIMTIWLLGDTIFLQPNGNGYEMLKHTLLRLTALTNHSLENSKTNNLQRKTAM